MLTADVLALEAVVFVLGVVVFCLGAAAYSSCGRPECDGVMASLVRWILFLGCVLAVYRHIVADW